VVQQIDNNFVSPTVLRATVRLHPTVTLLALVLGGAFAGIWGVIIAVPLTASLKILVGHWWRTRILDQTWEEASEAMFEEPDQSRLRRTGEMPVVAEDHRPAQESDDGRRTTDDGPAPESDGGPAAAGDGSVADDR
jgi:hypothetical protein